MIKIPVRLAWIAVCLLPMVLSAQVAIELTPGVKLTFPGPPEKLDTLGQQVYTYSDENAYYSCIIQKTNIDPVKLASLDILQFYSEIYQTVQNPADQCRPISQKEVVIQDTRGMEFYAQCAEREDVPELRYKRLVLVPPNLYVIDFWTTRAASDQAAGRKNAFFESMIFTPQGGQAVIPSALDKTESGGSGWTQYGYFLAAIAVLLVALLYLKKKPKK
ncbi:MAG TPA: hypothetical protein PKM27_10550 [Saprospiraceae bacterium]|nr:hypothetical protein [Saprospiraceae bacterium]HNT22398.1 hypothetical protein [Saprospiraceae bacterium]